VKIGDRKKKLKHSTPATEATIASGRAKAVAMPSVASKKVKPIVVLLAWLKMKK
jgi:hypothetical protein